MRPRAFAVAVTVIVVTGAEVVVVGISVINCVSIAIVALIGADSVVIGIAVIIGINTPVVVN